MDRMNTIQIDIGVYTAIDVDLSEYDFTGIEKLIFSVKNKLDIDSPVLIEREFTRPIKETITITPEESLLLDRGAEYDFIEVLKDTRVYKVTANGAISLRRGVGHA